MFRESGTLATFKSRTETTKDKLRVCALSHRHQKIVGKRRSDSPVSRETALLRRGRRGGAILILPVCGELQMFVENQQFATRTQSPGSVALKVLPSWQLGLRIGCWLETAALFFRRIL